MRNNRKSTKAVALALSAAMVFSVPVCAEESDSSAQEPITLTWGRLVSDCALGDGVHNDVPALKAIEEKTGVTIEFVTYDQQKFNVLAAGGDLPDIVSLYSDTAVFQSLVSSEQILPLDDLLDEYGENIKENIPEALAQNKGLYGNVYYLPVCCAEASTAPNANAYVNFLARYDIYKEIGSPEIHTEDDFLNVLKQMQDHQREKTGDNSIYALSSWTDSGTWPYIITYPFEFGLTNASVANYSIDIVTGEVESNFMKEDSVFWNGMRFFNKAYTMGIFDPDGFTQKSSQYNDKIAQGKVLVSGNWSQPSAEFCGEEAICVRLPGEYFPVISGVYSGASPYGYQLSSGRAITANCEYPERAMQLLNYLDSEEAARTIVNGIQGEDWDYIDGVPQFIGAMLEAYESGDSWNYRLERTAAGVGHQFLYSGIVKNKTSDYPIDLSTTEEFVMNNTTTAQKAFAQDFDENFTYPGQVYAKWIEEGMVKSVADGTGSLKTKFAPALSDGSNQIINEATDYFTSNVSKLIMAEDEDAFNAEKASMIEKFKEIGYEEAEAEVMQNYAISLETYNEIYGE